METVFAIFALFVALAILAALASLPAALFVLWKAPRTDPQQIPEARRLTGAALCLIGILLVPFALIYLFTVPRIYQATARVQIEREQDDLFQNENSTMIVRREEATYLQTQYKNMLNRSLIESVVAKLKLDQDERYRRNMDVVRAVAEDITIAPVPFSRLVDVKVEHPDPKKAANIANTLVENFKDQNLDRKTAGTLAVVNKLKTEADGEERKLEESEIVLAKYLSVHNFLPASRDQHPIAEAVLRAQRDLFEAKFRSEQASSTLAAEQRHKAAGKPLASFPPIASDNQLRQAQLELTRVEAELAGMSKGNVKDGQDTKPLQGKIEAARAVVERITQDRAELIQAESELAQANEQEKAHIAQRWENRYSDWNHDKVGYELLHERAESTKALYRLVLARMKEADLSARNKVDNIAVIDTASVPIRPIKPRIVLTLALAFGLGAPLFLIGAVLQRFPPGAGLKGEATQEPKPPVGAWAKLIAPLS